MGMFLPTDLPGKLVSFISGDLDIPLIRSDEIMGAFYLFGKDYGVSGKTEVLAVTDLAKRTIEQVGRSVSLFYRTPNKLSSSAIREDVMKRVLQISVELQQKKVDSGNAYKLNDRIVKDPVILSDFFSQHIAYYQQDYFFELFRPFKKTELPFSLRDKLEGRMLLLAYNVKNLKSLPFESSLSPFIQWLEKPTVNMSKV
jgi:hypothetical protein